MDLPKATHRWRTRAFRRNHDANVAKELRLWDSAPSRRAESLKTEFWMALEGLERHKQWLSLERESRKCIDMLTEVSNSQKCARGILSLNSDYRIYLGSVKQAYRRRVVFQPAVDLREQIRLH